MASSFKKASVAKNLAGDRVIKIEFPYDLDLLNQVRTIPGRKYHPDAECWTAPLFAETIRLLMSWGFTLDFQLDLFLEDANHRSKKILGDTIPRLKGTLYPFQSEGVDFIEARNGRALIADEMGLGKTVQALAWLQLHRELRPAIIVVPASLKLNWEREANKWLTDPSVEILQGTKPWKITGDIIVINYDILLPWIDSLKQTFPKVIITDECHYYKSNASNRTRAVKRLSKGIPNFIALSGTPILNRPIEIFNAINIIDPVLFPNWKAYVSRYCNPKHNGFGVDYTGHSHTDELHQKLKHSIMLRRLKKDVYKELPPKVKAFVPIAFNMHEYKAAEKDFISFVRTMKGREAAEKASNAAALVEIEGLKQLAVKGKLPQVISWISDFLDIEDKLVVFATHKFAIDALMQEFGKIAVKIDGSVSEKDRQKAVDLFQTNPKIKLFVGNIKAAGVGLTLTAASNVAFIELPWTPADLEQAEDRCHRITQKKEVTIYYLLAKGTIEEKIVKIINEKKKIVGAIIDGIASEQSSMLSLIIKEYQS